MCLPECAPQFLEVFDLAFAVCGAHSAPKHLFHKSRRLFSWHKTETCLARLACTRVRRCVAHQPKPRCQASLESIALFHSYLSGILFLERPKESFNDAVRQIVFLMLRCIKGRRSFTR